LYHLHHFFISYCTRPRLQTRMHYLVVILHTRCHFVQTSTREKYDKNSPYCTIRSGRNCRIGLGETESTAIGPLLFFSVTDGACCETDGIATDGFGLSTLIPNRPITDANASK